MSEIVGLDETRSIDALAARINEEHRACEQAVISAVEHAIRAGEMLLEAKERAGHGNWGDWLRENFEGSERHAQRYMHIARRKDELNPTRVSGLSLRGALRELSAPSEDEGVTDPTRKLTELEGVMADMTKDMIVAGRALAEIEESESYKAAGFRTFSRYCSDRLRLRRHQTQTLLLWGELGEAWPFARFETLPSGLPRFEFPDDLDHETWERGMRVLFEIFELLPPERVA